MAVLYGESSALQGDRHNFQASQKEIFKRDFYLPFIDRMLCEIQARFSEKACSILENASAFHPKNMTVENSYKLSVFTNWMLMLPKADSSCSVHPMKQKLGSKI